VDEQELHLVSELPNDLPDEDAIEGAKSRYTLAVTLVRRERLTVRQLFGRLVGPRPSDVRGHSRSGVADAMQHRWENGANVVVIGAGPAGTSSSSSSSETERSRLSKPT
jgi:hypothetical protein